MSLPRPEWLAIGVNTTILIRYLCARPIEPGKILYWLGGIIVMAGILRMRG